MSTGKFLRVRVRNPGNCGKQSGKFLEGLECFQTCWRIFGRSEKFLVCLDSFRTVPNSLRSFRMVWQVCSHLGGLYFTVGCQVQYGNEHKKQRTWFCTCSIYNAHAFHKKYRKQNLRTLSVKFLCVKVCQVESSEFFGLWNFERNFDNWETEIWEDLIKIVESQGKCHLYQKHLVDCLETRISKRTFTM